MYEYNAVLDRVVDGDTIDVTIDLGFKVWKKMRVRMEGINTPESRTRNKDEKARGKLAAKFLSDAVSSGDVVLKTKLKDSRGKFGRVLATVWVDGKNINQSMIDHYHAAEYYGQSKEEIEAIHEQNRSKLIELGEFIPND